MRRWILIGLGVIAALLGVVWVAGSFISREHRAASRIIIERPIDTVWAMVRNPGSLLGTWTDLTQAERISPDPQGRERWQETVDGFEMRLIVVETEAPSRMVTQVESEPGSPFGGHWIVELAPSDGGTRVTLAEEGWIGPPPFRVMSRVMGYHRSIDGYLVALGKHFGESPVPEHVP